MNEETELMRLTVLTYPDNEDGDYPFVDYIVKQFDVSNGFVNFVTDENIRIGLNVVDVAKYILSYDEVDE